MTGATDQPHEKSTARENHLTVRLDARTGAVKVLSDADAERAAGVSVRDAIRKGQERSGVRLMASAA
jgi:hypothetical protein